MKRCNVSASFHLFNFSPFQTFTFSTFHLFNLSPFQTFTFIPGTVMRGCTCRQNVTISRIYLAADSVKRLKRVLGNKSICAMGIISYPEFAHTLIKFSEHRPMETYTKSSFIVCRLWRCTLRLILSYVALGAVRSI